MSSIYGSGIDYSNGSNVEYFGNTGVRLIDAGELTTDRYGLTTCNAVFECPSGEYLSLPNLYSIHPLFTTMAVEKRTIKFLGPFARATCYYTGGEFTGTSPETTTPVYDLDVGGCEEPIATHPDFEDSIGGIPSAPLNKALFVDSSGAITTNDDQGVFRAFASGSALFGVDSYFNPSQITWTKSWTGIYSITSASAVGSISVPDGPAPSLAAGANWLLVSVRSTQRGSVWSNSMTWMASGPGGWKSQIYG